jgi:hypothetical protein
MLRLLGAVQILTDHSEIGGEVFGIVGVVAVHGGPGAGLLRGYFSIAGYGECGEVLSLCLVGAV